MSKLSVYGTLKKGFHNNYMLKDSQYVGKWNLPPNYTMLNLGSYPGVVPGGNTPVRGEVWEVSEEVLKRLDQFEGHPHLFKRVPVDDDIEMYLYQHSPIVDSGLWTKE